MRAYHPEHTPTVRVVITEFMDTREVLELTEGHDVLYDPRLVDDPARLRAEAADAEVLVVRDRTPVRGELLSSLARCRVVLQQGGVCDNVDLEACRARGIEVEHGAPVEVPADLVYGCLTHVPLWIDFPSYVRPIFLGAAQHDGALNVRDLAPEWDRHHPILAGLAGTFALKNYVLQQHPGARTVGVCQYRKFIASARFGTPSATFGPMNVLRKSDLARVSLHDLMAPRPAAFMIGLPSLLRHNGSERTYLQQYADAHHVEDLLRFTAEAVALGVLDKNDVEPFFQSRLFYTGGVELGFYPAPFWLRAVTEIEAVVRACIARHPDARSGPQARAWAFCAERFGSFVLARHLQREHASVDWVRDYFGQLYTVNENDGLEYVSGT